MDISEAINQLNELKYPYPTEAVRYVREHKDEAVPALMMNIQRQLDELPNESPSTLDTILSYYLLAEFRIKEALPLLLRPLRLDEKALDYVLGDIVFDGYGGIIASCADAADLPLIEAIVLDESVSKYARDAALTSLNVLYAEGDLSRDALAGVYRRLLDSLLKHDSDDDDEPFLLPSAVNNTANLHLDEFYDDAKAMFDKFGSSDFFGEWEDWLSKYNASASDAKAAYL
ncbi:MAG: DUF1186 family protein, partial [Oscillospiraceae bacterium]|nr:DUF1186 family protein [Oscillospiraceae bacterium]